jgi:MinD-like ATPase involved in chromosome partitioning or flagellar assembly
MKPRIVAIAGHDGGVGKTALCLGLAARYFRARRSVLVVDLDPQGIASRALRVEATGKNLAAVLRGTSKPEPATIWCGRLMPGGPALENVANPRPLRQALNGLMDMVDLVLVYCAPEHAALNRLDLKTADAVLVVIGSHDGDILGAAHVLEEAKNLGLGPRSALVWDRRGEHPGLDADAPERLAGTFGVKPFTLRQDAALDAALNAAGLPPKHGRAAEDMEKVADWLNLETEEWKWNPKSPKQ